MLGRKRTWTATIVGLLVLLGACGSDGNESTNGDSAATSGHSDAADADADADADAEKAGYCAGIHNLMSVLDTGGSASDYDAALIRVSNASPPDHGGVWALLLTLSQEPFDYENFNPAVDALDAISADIEATCSGVDRLIIDDDGRVRQLQPD